MSPNQTNEKGDRMEAKHRHTCHSPTADYMNSILRESLEDRIGTSLVYLHQGTVGGTDVFIPSHSLAIGQGLLLRK